MGRTLQEIIQNSYQADGILLNAMHRVQEELGCLPPEAIQELAKTFGIPAAQVLSSSTFYNMFRLTPSASIRIQICRSAPCHVAGATELIAGLESALGIKMGQTTPDGRYALEYVECVGQCQQAPVVLINGVLHGNVTLEQIALLLGKGAKQA